MSAVLDTTAHQINDAIRNYNVGELQEYHLAGHGIENANYFVKTQVEDQRSREYVLTFVQQASNAGHLYAPMMEALFAQGLPVAPPLQQSQTSTENRDNHEQPILLQYRLPGSHTINPTLRQIEAIGRFTARMHICLARADFKLPAFPRTPEWLQQKTESWLTDLPYGDRRLLQDSLAKVTAFLARQDVHELPNGMIHGDLFRDNVLFNERGLTGVLDFHHAASGFWVFDLAVIANDWCTDNQGGLDPDRTLALLSAYHQVRPIQEQELWFFSSFSLYAALCFWVSRLLTVLEARTNPEKQLRTKDPNEFKRIVLHHLGHPLYIDPRLLAVRR